MEAEGDQPARVGMRRRELLDDSDITINERIDDKDIEQIISNTAATIPLTTKVSRVLVSRLSSFHRVFAVAAEKT